MCNFRMMIRLLLVFAIAITDASSAGEQSSDQGYGSLPRGENRRSSQNTPRWSQFFVMHEPRMQSTDKKRGFFYEVGDQPSGENRLVSSSSVNNQRSSVNYQLLDDGMRAEPNHRSSFSQINRRKLQPATQTKFHTLSSQIHIPLPKEKPVIKTEEALVQPKYSHETAFPTGQAIETRRRSQTYNNRPISTGSIENETSKNFRGDQISRNVEEKFPERNQENLPDRQRRRRQRRPSSRAQSHTTTINNRNRNRRPLTAREKTSVTPYPSNSSEVHNGHMALIKSDTTQSPQKFQTLSVARQIHNGRIGNTNRRKNQPVFSTEEQVKAQKLISDNRSTSPASHTIRLNRRRPFNLRRTTERNKVLEKDSDNLHSDKHSTSVIEPQWDEDHHNHTTSTQGIKPSNARYGNRMPSQSHTISIRRQGNRRPRLNRRKNSTSIDFPGSSQIQNSPNRDSSSEDNTPAQTEIVPKLEMESLGSHLHISMPEAPIGDNTHKSSLTTAFGIRLKVSNSTEPHLNGKKDDSYLGSQESEISFTKKEHPPDVDTNQKQEDISTASTDIQIPRTSTLDSNERSLSVASLVTQFDDESAEEKVPNRVRLSSRTREISEDDFVLVPPTVIEEERDIKPYRLPKFYPNNYNHPRTQSNAHNQNRFFNTESNINPTYKNEQYEQSRRNFNPESNKQSINIPSHSYDIYPQRLQPKLNPSRNLDSSFTHEGSFAKHEILNEPIIKYDSKGLAGSQILSKITTTASSLESEKIHDSQAKEIRKKVIKNPEKADLPQNQHIPKHITSHQTNILSGPGIQHGFVHTQLQLPPLNFRFHLTPVQGNVNASLISGTYQNHNFQSDHVPSNNHYQPPIPYHHAPVYSGHTVSNNQHHSDAYNHPLQYQPPVSPYQTLHRSQQPSRASQPNAREMRYQAENLRSNNAKQSERGPDITFHENSRNYPHQLTPLNNEKNPGTYGSLNANENPFSAANFNQFQGAPGINTPWKPTGPNADFNAPYITLYLRNLNPVLHDQTQSNDSPILKADGNKMTQNEPSTLQIRKRLEEIASNGNSKQNVTSHQNNNSLSLTERQSSSVSNPKPISTNGDQTNSTHDEEIPVTKMDLIISGNDESLPTVKEALINEKIVNTKLQNSSHPHAPVLEKRKKVDRSSDIFNITNATIPSIMDTTSTDSTTNVKEILEELNANHSTFREMESNFQKMNQDLKNEKFVTSSIPWTNDNTKEFEFEISLITNSTEIPDSTVSSQSDTTTGPAFTIVNETNPPLDNSLTTTRLLASNTTNTLQNLIPEFTASPLIREMKTMLSFIVSNEKSVPQPTTPGVSYDEYPFSKKESNVSQAPSIIESIVSLSDNDENLRTSIVSLNQTTTYPNGEQFSQSISTQSSDALFEASGTKAKEITEVTTVSILSNVTTIEDNPVTLKSTASSVPGLKDSISKIIENVNNISNTPMNADMNSSLLTSTMILTESSTAASKFDELKITRVATKIQESDDPNVSVSTLKELPDMEKLTTKPSEINTIDLNQKVLNNPTVMDFSKITNSPIQPKKIVIQRVGSLKIPSDASVFMFTELPYNKNVFSSSSANSGTRQIDANKSSKALNDIFHNDNSFKIPFDNEKSISNSTTITNNMQEINTSENLLKMKELMENNTKSDISRFMNILTDKALTVSEINLNSESSTIQPANEETSSAEFDVSDLAFKDDNTNEHFNITESLLDLRRREHKLLKENSILSSHILEEMVSTATDPSHSDFIITGSTINNLPNNSSIILSTIVDRNKSTESNNLNITTQLISKNLINNKTSNTLEKENASIVRPIESSQLNEANKIKTDRISEAPCDTISQSSITSSLKNTKDNDKDSKASINDLEVPKAKQSDVNASETVLVNNDSKVLVAHHHSSSAEVNKNNGISADDEETESFSTTEGIPLSTKIEPHLAPMTLKEVTAGATSQNLSEIIAKKDVSEMVPTIKELKPTASNMRDVAIQDSHQIRLETTISPTGKLEPSNSDCGLVKESNSLKESLSKVDSDKPLIISLDKTS